MLVVAAALVDGDGRVLVQRRPAGKPMAGLWEFPGGKVEAGELPEFALARELEEELGISLDPGLVKPCAFASETLGTKHLLLLLYTLRNWSGTPAARHADALQWVYPGELHALEMPPADVPLIAALEKLV
nr:(deoxy)nucleoside triphosphate pyrophosphohydrolase [Sphingomonas xinjiangensis]